MNTSLEKWLAQTCFLWVCVSGCAAITPAITGADAAESEASTLSVYEGRPSSVVLQLAATDPTADTIELWRATDAQEPILVQTTALDEATRLSITQAGVLLVDHEPPFGALVYMVVFRAKGEMTQTTSPVKVQWEASPEAPILALESLGTQSVRLRWNQAVQDGCVVFRRDLISGEKPRVLARMNASCDGAFLDTSVHPSGVYSYRVATSDLRFGFPRYSEPSVETYITIPEGP